MSIRRLTQGLALGLVLASATALADANQNGAHAVQHFSSLSPVDGGHLGLVGHLGYDTALAPTLDSGVACASGRALGYYTSPVSGAFEGAGAGLGGCGWYGAGGACAALAADNLGQSTAASLGTADGRWAAACADPGTARAVAVVHNEALGGTASSTSVDACLLTEGSVHSTGSALDLHGFPVRAGAPCP